MDASLGSHVHPDVDGVPTDFISSGDLGNFTAGPSLFDDGQFDFCAGMSVGHNNTNKS